MKWILSFWRPKNYHFFIWVALDVELMININFWQIQVWNFSKNQNSKPSRWLYVAMSKIPIRLPRSVHEGKLKKRKILRIFSSFFAAKPKIGNLYLFIAIHWFMAKAKFPLWPPRGRIRGNGSTARTMMRMMTTTILNTVKMFYFHEIFSSFFSIKQTKDDLFCFHEIFLM